MMRFKIRLIKKRLKNHKANQTSQPNSINTNHVNEMTKLEGKMKNITKLNSKINLM
jgi:hypothetical protein